ncbi:mechanosensitive ion channel protein 9-like [Apium graveolens]|uniref:mechanosensitive ion channel protein 9-like n=1 Tax=Apium graveolens TaxID=4045 RepID=UPI003D78E551
MIILLNIVDRSFHIGDHCIIENEQYVVEDIGLYSTIMRKDGEYVSLPNTFLLIKSVSNLDRSSDMTEAFDIVVSSTTSSDNNATGLKSKIEELIRSKPQNWHPEFCLISKGVDDDGKDMFYLKITNVREFENFDVKEVQRSEFILQLESLPSTWVR